MGALARFFCLSSSPTKPSRSDWSMDARRYAEPYGDHYQSKVLELVQQELDRRLAGASLTLQQLSSTELRRIPNSGLPARELQLCRELLAKVALLDQAREAAAEEAKKLERALKAAEQSHRQAEFSRAKAEALATARGEALMHAQQATKVAQQENSQLSDLLKQAVQQLGLAITPSRSQAGTPEGSFLPPLEQAHTPALLPQAPPSAEPSTAPPPPQQQQQQRRRSQGQQEEQAQRPSLAEGSQHSQQFSGFTVYTNEMANSAELASAQPAQLPREQDGSQDLRASSVPWRSISSAAEASLSVERSDGRRRSRTSGGSYQRPPSRLAASSGAGSLVGGSVAAGSATFDNGLANSAEPQQEQQAANREQFRRMARLVLPTLDASQLDSLVRIGASLPSPDMLMSPEVLGQLLPKLWDSSTNPLQSAAPDMQQLLQQLQIQQPPNGTAGASHQPPAQQQQQQVGASRPVPAMEARQSQGAESQAVPRAAGIGRQGQSVEVRSSAASHASHTSRPPKAGTWLSPLKIGQQPHMDGEPTPSPASHIKAVFANTDDIQFYLPFSAGLQKPYAAAKEEYRNRTAAVAGPAPPAPALAPGPQQGARSAPGQPGRHSRDGSVGEVQRSGDTLAGEARPMRHSREPSAGEVRHSRHSSEQGARQSAEGARHSRGQSAGEAQSGSGSWQRHSAASGGSQWSGELGQPAAAGAGGAGSRAGTSHSGSLHGSRESLVPGQQPATRTQAFLSRFQPMGSHVAQQPAGPSRADPPGHPPAASGKPPPYRGVSVDENVRDVPPAAAYHRQPPREEAWQQQQQQPLRQLAGGHQLANGACAPPARAVADSGQGRQPGMPAKRPAVYAGGLASNAALCDTTNAGADSSYLRRLAQERVQQAYGPSSHLH